MSDCMELRMFEKDVRHSSWIFYAKQTSRIALYIAYSAINDEYERQH